MIPCERSKHIGQTTHPTPDGTCVRDYVHMADIAATHVAAAVSLASGAHLDPRLQPGQRHRRLRASDHGRVCAGHRQRLRAGDRTPASRDPSWIVSSGETAARDLGWTMRYSLTQNGRERLLLEAIARPASRDEPSACRDWPFVTPGALTPEHLEGLR